MSSSLNPAEWKAPSGPDEGFTVRVEVRERLDRFLSKNFPALSRTRWQEEIARGSVSVNGQKILDADYRLKPGDEVIAFAHPRPARELSPRPLSLSILYADSHIVVVDKPAGLVVHPGARGEEETLVHGLLHRFPQLREQGVLGGNLRPGIVHRLDKGTSGVMVVALTERARLGLVNLFQRQGVRKRYLAWVLGHPPEEGEWSGSIARDPRDRKRFTVSPLGKPARTRFRLLRRYRTGSQIEVFPLTGRTHQIRVHAYHAGFPLFGDGVYRFRSFKRYPLPEWGPDRNRPALHAVEISFPHPILGEWLSFSSPLPQDLLELDEELRAL